MLSTLANANSGGASRMPGEYESWPGAIGRNGPFTAPEPMVPSARTPFPRLPTAEPTVELPGGPPYAGPGGRTPFPRLPGPGIRPPPIAPLRHHRRRRRPLSPDMFVNHRRHHHSRWGRPQVVVVPFDRRPTLGLRGPPRHLIEIERVRCHRHRRPRSRCYEYDDDYDDCDHIPPPPQPNIVVADPMTGLHLPLAQSPLMVTTNNNITAASAAFLSNLTQETVDRLPRHTVHLPSIHLPGSQADANTELDTVILPAEIINPINGTLSIIQGNPGINTAGTMNIQPMMGALVQPQLINLPSNIGLPIATAGTVGVPQVSPAMAADPVMQRFQQLFQRLHFPQRQPMSPATMPPAIRPTLSNMSQAYPTTNTVNNPPIIAPLNTPSTTSFPSLNTRPTNTVNNTPSTTPFPSLNTRPTNTVNFPPTIPTSSTPYRPANITPYRPSSTMTNNAGYDLNTTTPSIASNVTPYRPASTTPYRSSSFTPSATTNNTPYRSGNVPSNVTPYTPPNTTSYTTFADRANTNQTPNTSTSLVASSGVGNNNMNSSPASNPFQANPTMPRSILRNAPSTDPPNPTYTRLNTPDFLSSNDDARKTTKFP